MGGYNAAGVFELAEHKCGRNNATHQRRIDEWMDILKEYAEPPTQDVAVLSERLKVALEKLRQTELWVRFKSEEEVDLEADSDSSECNSFDDLCEDSEEEKPNACNGCLYARMFYQGGPLTLICCLDEDFGEHKYQKQDHEICTVALEAIHAEMATAKNIQDHSKELYLE